VHVPPPPPPPAAVVTDALDELVLPSGALASGSAVSLDTVAVLVICRVRGSTTVHLILSTKFVLPPRGRLAIVHVTVPALPAVGVVQVKLGPDWVKLENVVLAGSGSFKTTFTASSGPLFKRVIKKVPFEPALTLDSSAAFTTCKSADGFAGSVTTNLVVATSEPLEEQH
jgi:hypothetical protein